MLEILFLVWFCRKLAAIATAKNRSSSWGALGAILWIGGEIGGFMVGREALEDGAELVNIYPTMIAGAIAGAVAAWVMVAMLKPIPRDGDLPVARVI